MVVTLTIAAAVGAALARLFGKDVLEFVELDWVDKFLDAGIVERLDVGYVITEDDEAYRMTEAGKLAGEVLQKAREAFAEASHDPEQPSVLSDDLSDKE